jgi:phage baseplate assembly protein W
MIPTSPDVTIGNDLEFTQRTNRTYKIIGDRIAGFVDGIDAIRQAIYKILSTERYKFIIYSHDYGVEYEQLIGKSKDLTQNEFQRITREALLEDTRILSVTDFTFDFNGNNFTSTFLVRTILGNFVEEIQI